MSSLCASATARTVQLILGFHHPSTRAEIPSINVLRFIPGASPTSPNFRFKCNGTLRVRGRFTTVSASNSNSTGGNSPNNRPNADEETDAAQGSYELCVTKELL
ncbi:hypothetical protein O6P43_001297 [Quillaja saponaria]|uniref:Uncharacterized protein n=1 Tax=Quillaja saponaria TaxID=32244 RepID=A0AAD7QII2_QUISA|nr:hypothetical protein O6P43_001297 [Quillaja saponaria]